MHSDQQGAANNPAGARMFAPKALCLDIETAFDDSFELRKLAAWRCDTGGALCVANVRRAKSLAAQLDALTQGAAFVVGHNVLRHDLLVLQRHFPKLRLHALPIVDTLLLSPIAFPQNPYHRLIKDYKLVRDARSDPLRDAQLAFQLWKDQFEAFSVLQADRPEEFACYHYLLTRDPALGLGGLFALVRRALPPGIEEVKQVALRLTDGKVCASRVQRVLDGCLIEPDHALPLAYLLAWLRVSGGNSVIPPWVRHNYPFVRELLRQLRDTSCAASACGYCREHLDPRRDLRRYFGFDAFRAEPRNASGGSLQEDIVRAAYAGRSLLAMLPTGGGKSICYQLPGLSRHWRNGSLTVIVSPLQSLMKDQVDNLVKLGVFSAATLNGLLSMPERRDVLEKIRLGDVGIILVSPEQFRNKAFAEAIRHREIGGWVFDEAHCLSKWGNDFRPDYLYVARFIRERHSESLAPVCCFTATARSEVVEDLCTHFREVLALEIEVFDGGHERENLHYEVMQVAAAEKRPLIQGLLAHELKETSGGAVVFASRRARCEEIAGFLKEFGWACAAFHAGLEPGQKKDIQQAFIEGSLNVIVATNAFGMGVDKPNVRIVIHADIPGSLENYLQEAGRAGRDRQDSRCVLLYDEEDVEEQFAIAARSRLSRRDIAGILRSLRRYSARTKNPEIVVTPGEILADEQAETAIEAASPDADTKVRTAIAWLERARFLRRDENHVRVYPGSLRVATIEAAQVRLARADLSATLRAEYLDLLRALINARDDEGISTDELMLQLGISAQQCVRMLSQLEELDILSNDIALTVLLRKGVKDASSERLARLIRLEEALLGVLPELAPDAAAESWQAMDLRALCQRSKEVAELDCRPDVVLTLMRSLARPFGDGQAAPRALFDVRVVRREVLRVKLLRDWSNIREIAARRRSVATVLLRTLLARLEPRLHGVDLRVACKLGELGNEVRSDAQLGPVLKDELRAIEAGLLYLHDNGVLIIDRGKSVFRAAMTLRLEPVEKRRGFKNSDFAPLQAHYDEKNFQVHVIQEYARLGLEKLSDALAFVIAYFSMAQLAFIRRYFAGRREILERATTAESWRRIVAELQHPRQEQIVTAGVDGNRLVLAGPGSGKTRVIVHRVAYLVRVLREPARSIVVLAFNRSAAWEIRQRLYALIGKGAAGVTVLTYHALALRLTGSSLAGVAAQEAEVDFEAILERALALLEAGDQAAGVVDDEDLRERLLAGYRHILVDEYQDIDERQYRLVSAMTGRRLRDRDAKLTLLAVGDDDQNIYAFRATSNEFITRFQRDYEAATDYLVENYRSSANIIAVSNRVIAGNRARLKAEYPIRIDHTRCEAPSGGRWQALDPIGQGRVRVLAVPIDKIAQAGAVMAELERIKSLDAGAAWSEFAVLARNRASLEPIRAWCELEGVAWCSPDDAKGQPRVTQTREGHVLLDLLAAKPRRSLRAATLARWFVRRFRGGCEANPWEGLLGQFIAELQGSWPEDRVPAALIADAFYEFGYEARRSEHGRLFLSTVHGAKGREFRHVAILDGGEWKRAAEDERRLYYVGMTRARENLILCEAHRRPNPFSRVLEGDGIVRLDAAFPPVRRTELARRHVVLGQSEVDLGYGGRFAAKHSVHRALSGVSYGDELALVIKGDRRELRTLQGIVVGKLARKAVLPSGRITEVTVESVMRWSRKRTDPDHRDRLRVDEWWVVLPRLIIEPEDDAGRSISPEIS